MVVVLPAPAGDPWTVSGGAPTSLTCTRRSVSCVSSSQKSSRSARGSSDDSTTPTYEPGSGAIMSGNMKTPVLQSRTGESVAIRG